MPATYEPIANTTLGSDTATVTFSSISQSFTDLVIIVNAANDQTSTSSIGLRFQVGNGSVDTGSNYSATFLYAETSALSTRVSNQTGGYSGELLGTIDKASTTILNVMNYSNTTTNKTILARSGTANARIDSTVTLWRSTSAINTIKFYLNANQFKTGSTFTLYGIKAA